MISASKSYFSAIRRGESPDEIDKANTATLAALWQQGKLNPTTLKELKKLGFYDPLDKLLDVQKIANDFR
jgi:hypothetical protein